MNRSSVVTLVKRISLYVVLVKLDGNTAQDMLEPFTRRLRSVPENLRKTMSYDQGSALALHEALSAQLRIDILFCNPHSPLAARLQRNANGLREYVPKTWISVRSVISNSPPSSNRSTIVRSRSSTSTPRMKSSQY